MQRKIRIKQNGKIIAADVAVADNFFTRFKGLMWKKSLNKGEGLLLTKTGMVHTNFMKFIIDVVYLDKSLNALYIESLKPWRIGRKIKGACHVLEFPEGFASQIETGKQIELSDYMLK